MSARELEATAMAMVARGKGILAIDESLPTIKKRFETINFECTEEHRRAYRELLIDNAGAAPYISGLILFEETIRQATADGVPFPKVLADKGIIPGIKVDKGAKDLACNPGEKVTEGLDGLRERLALPFRLPDPSGARETSYLSALHQLSAHLPHIRAKLLAAAHAALEAAQPRFGGGIVTLIEPAQEFWRAEDYHQNYFQNNPNAACHI